MIRKLLQQCCTSKWTAVLLQAVKLSGIPLRGNTGRNQDVQTVTVERQLTSSAATTVEPFQPPQVHMATYIADVVSGLSFYIVQRKQSDRSVQIPVGLVIACTGNLPDPIFDLPS